MAAYILRRLLLIVPTLFGILLINFVLVQFMPGGPVEQVIAQLEDETSATDRITGGGGETARRRRSEYRGAQGLPPEFIADLERQFGFDKPPLERFLLMLGNYLTLRLRRELLPLDPRGRPGAGEDAGLDHARPLVDAARLPDLDPARHPQGDARRQRVRHLDQRPDHRRLCDPELPLRDHAAGAVRRRLLLADLPAARPDLRQLGRAQPRRQGRSTTSGTSRCR